MKLGLGTVQFGQAYGVAGAGQVHLSSVREILAVGQEHGMDLLDTAVAYGASESVLGEASTKGWRVVTKIPAVPEGRNAAEWVQEQVEGSLTRLKIERLYGVLLHHPDQLHSDHGNGLVAGLLSLKAAGLVSRIGASIYEPRELDFIDALMPLELLQAPFNLLDHRLESSGWLGRLHRRGCEVHVRSVFLQGLLLQGVEGRPDKFKRFQAVWEAWDSFLGETGRSPLAACISFAYSHPEVDRVIVGVDGPDHLRGILQATKEPSPDERPRWPDMVDPVLMNPSLWGTL